MGEQTIMVGEPAREIDERLAQAIWDEICAEATKGGDRTSREIILNAFPAIRGALCDYGCGGTQGHSGPCVMEIVSRSGTKEMAAELVFAWAEDRHLLTVLNRDDKAILIDRVANSLRARCNALEVANKELRDVLEDLIHQLPTDERLADFNLDRAEAALAEGDRPVK